MITGCVDFRPDRRSGDRGMLELPGPGAFAPRGSVPEGVQERLS